MKKKKKRLKCRLLLTQSLGHVSIWLIALKKNLFFFSFSLMGFKSQGKFTLTSFLLALKANFLLLHGWLHLLNLLFEFGRL